MVKNEISREKLNNALNIIKTEYNENKVEMQEIDEKSKKYEVTLKYDNATKMILQSKLSSFKFSDRLFYIQLLAFGSSIVSAFLGAPILVPLFVSGVTIFEAFAFAKRFKKKENTQKYLNGLNVIIKKTEAKLKQLNTTYTYLAEKDLTLMKKIDCLQNYVFDQKHPDTFDLNEIFEKTSKIEQEFQKNIDNIKL